MAIAQIVICAHCGETNDAEAWVCRRCGEGLVWEPCPQCGQPVAFPNAGVCGHCGAPAGTVPEDPDPATPVHAMHAGPQAATGEAAALPATLDLHIEDLPRSDDRACPECGAAVGPTMRQCARCGAYLQPLLAVSSTQVVPVTQVPARTWRARRRWPWAVLVIAVVVVAAFLVAAPAARAHVPALDAITRAAGQMLDRSRDWVLRRLPSADRPAGSVRPSAQTAPPNSDNPAAPPARVAPQRSAPQAGTGTLAVRSSPTGARVEVAGRPRRTTPVTVRGLPFGTYTVRVSLPGHRSVVRTIRIGDEPATMIVALESAPPAPKRISTQSSASPAHGPAAGRAPNIGAAAPAFALKDRLGVIYRLPDLRGGRGVILFVWDLQPRARSLIAALDSHAAASGVAAWVVVIRPDRTAIREYVQTAGVRVPLLFGTDRVAAAYAVPPGVPALYVISETGTIARRQVGQVTVAL